MYADEQGANAPCVRDLNNCIMIMMNEDEFNEIENKSKYNNFFYTVTPFSKYLSIMLFIVLPFFGFWIGFNLNNKNSNCDSNVIDNNFKSQKENIFPSDVSDANKKQQNDLDDGVKNVHEVIKIEQRKMSGTNINKDEWLVYRSDNFGFEFLYPAEVNVSESDDGIKLSESSIYKNRVPTIVVTKNNNNMTLLDVLSNVVYAYTISPITAERTKDGIPTFKICSLEGGFCSYYIVSEKFIYNIDTLLIDTIKFNENVSGHIERNINWPVEINRPLLSD